jgi:hypothetical protein
MIRVQLGWARQVEGVRESKLQKYKIIKKNGKAIPARGRGGP